MKTPQYKDFEGKPEMFDIAQDHYIDYLEAQLKFKNNGGLADVSNLVCPTHGVKLYKHPNGNAYCSLCNYSTTWQT